MDIKFIFRISILLLFLTILSITSFSQSHSGVNNETHLYLYVDKMPSFSSVGNRNLKDFIKNNLKWPESEISLQGSVLASFVVTKTGSVKSIEIIKSLSKSSDDEVIRLIRQMPRWKAGEKDGKKIDVKLYLPVDFFLR